MYESRLKEFAAAQQQHLLDDTISCVDKTWKRSAELQLYIWNHQTYLMLSSHMWTMATHQRAQSSMQQLCNDGNDDWHTALDA